MQAVIFCGIQATGKSTFFKRRFVDTHIRINLDMLNTRHRERILVEACLEAKQPFVVENTNPSREERERYIDRAKAHRFEVIGYYFRSRAEEAIRRNARRPEPQRIPEEGIWGTAGRLEIPSYDEGFDKLYYVRIEEGRFVVDDWDENA